MSLSANPVDHSIKVLLVEDDEDDYVIVRDLLNDVQDRAFCLDWVSMFTDAAQQIATQQHDIYLIDYRLGDRNGLELLELVTQQESQSPVIILSGRGDRDLAITSLRAGAADYLDKAYLQSPLLEHFIRVSIERNQAIWALRERERQYRTLFEQERQTRKALARSNAELENFAYVASHDLQEPIRAIAAYTQLLQEHYGNQFDTTAREYMAFVQDGAVRMKALIQDLLAYSRLKAPSKEDAEVDCNQVLTDVILNLGVVIQENQVELEVDDLPKVMGDRTQLVQLFQNLISNAIKFQHHVSPKINVWAELGERFWTFYVADNGIGIEADYYERVFQIFKRLHTQQEYSGTGIGLAICQKIVENHGGKIWLESQVGVGTTFYFTLPKAKTAKG